MLLITFLVAWSASAHAQLFRNRTKAPPAAQRVGELIVQAKSDPDERKRATAAGELRDFDAKTYPEIVSVLADVARTDTKPNVRHEALESLSRIRPVTIMAGQALERAASSDDSWKVRWQAKSALMRYQIAGYHPAKNQANGKDQANANNPGQPPLAPPPMTQEPPLVQSAPPQAKSNVIGRNLPSRTAVQPRTIVPPPNPRPSVPPSLPSIVNQPQPQPQSPQFNPPAPRVSVTPTPPPIIVDVPPTLDVPAPKNVQAPAAKNQVPALPVVDSAPKVNLPAAPPIVSPSSEVIEPTFRPAGPTPPRVPPVEKKKTEESGPALTVPM
jgi:hypothetical protein